jgi:hypothetical protein
LHAVSGWDLLGTWRARHQFRWNKDTPQVNVKQIIEFLLARVGLKLAVISQSAVATGFYPDMTIHPGDSGTAVMERLLSLVPDCIFMEGDTACLLDPHEDDTSVYAYGLPDHAITAGNYLTGRRKTDQVRIDGSGVTLDVRNWQQIEKHPQRWRSVSDAAISTLSEAQDRGDALLRKAAMGAVSGSIAVPVNCGQQLYDVIEVTDARVGMEAAPKRVLGIATIYNTVRGEYRQKMLLGGV